MSDVYIDRLGVVRRRYNDGSYGVGGRSRGGWFGEVFRVRPRTLCFWLAVHAALYATNPSRAWNDHHGTTMFGSSSSWRRWWTDLVADGRDRLGRATTRSSSSSDHRGRRTRVGSVDLSWLFGIELDVYESGGVGGVGRTDSFANSGRTTRAKDDSPLTDFVIFSLSKSSRGVRLHALNRGWDACRFRRSYHHGDDDDALRSALSELEGAVCDFVARNLCHGMTAFAADHRAFTAHRVLLYVLVVSHLASLCARPHVFFGRHPFVRFVFAEPRPTDYVYTHLYLWPFLRWLERSTKADYPPWRYYVDVALLVVVAGYACRRSAEFLASTNRRRRDGGHARLASYAVALGYLVVVRGPRPRAADPFRFDRWWWWWWDDGARDAVDPAAALTSTALLGAVDLLLGSGGRWFPFEDLIAWVVGGLAGTALGELCTNHHHHHRARWSSSPWWFG